MTRSVLFAPSLGILMLLHAQPSAAEAPAVPSAVVLVIESSGGVRAAAEVRAALNQAAELHALSLREAARQNIVPTAIIDVAAQSAHTVDVVYFDLTGTMDSLTAPAPATAAELSAVVTALASALLARHQADLRATALHPPSLVRSHDPDVIYALFGGTGHFGSRTNAVLRLEDF